MSGKDDVKLRFEPGKAPDLTAEQQSRIRKLAELPDETIDYSDIPPLTERFWRNTVANPLYKPVKSQLTVRLDSDVLEWLRASGRGYQTRLNSILREAMLRDLGNSPEPADLAKTSTSRKQA